MPGDAAFGTGTAAESLGTAELLRGKNPCVADQGSLFSCHGAR